MNRIRENATLMAYLFLFTTFLVLTYFFMYSNYHSCRMISRSSERKLQKQNNKIVPFSLKKENLPLYVISIDQERYKEAEARFKTWNKDVKLWDGVRGNKSELLREDSHRRVYDVSCPNHHIHSKLGTMVVVEPYTLYKFQHNYLRKGEIGCYLSHLNLWYRSAYSNTSKYTIVMEDDCSMTDEHYDYVNNVMDEMNRLDSNWDIFYMSRLPEHSTDEFYFSENLCRPKEARGTHAYVISNTCAAYLVDHAFPIKYPVDVYISKHLKHLRCYAPTKNVFHQVDLFDSFTTNIV